ncbi:hypothetical protein L5D93_01515 [Paenibacillus thiaminolyticus]|nr:hypothetical protein [Paenibacillus thiaminolyticus]
MKTSILFYDLEGKNVVANNLECVDLSGPEISALLALNTITIPDKRPGGTAVLTEILERSNVIADGELHLLIIAKERVIPED